MDEYGCHSYKPVFPAMLLLKNRNVCDHHTYCTPLKDSKNLDEGKFTKAEQVCFYHKFWKPLASVKKTVINQ